LAFTTILGSGGAPDSFVGTAGIDAIAFAASRASYFLGAQGDNDVVAWVGTDQMDITVTNATIRGGGGNDFFTVADALFASVVINGNAGNDVFQFWPGPTDFLGSTLYGGQGDDLILLDDVSSSLINGNKGNDYINVGDDGDLIANASIFGGQGDDTIKLWGEILNTVVNGDLGDDYIGSGFEGTTAFVASGNDGADTVCGGAADDTLYGNEGSDFVAGNGGSDTIVGGRGSDTLYAEYYEDNGRFGVDGENLFIFNAGDSFAATAGAGNSVTFGNGVDWIVDYSEALDSVEYNGTSFDFEGAGAVGFARIVNGSYVIEQASANGLVVVLGTFDRDNQTFTDSFTDNDNDVLWFASAAGVGSTLNATQVEAFVATTDDLVLASVGGEQWFQYAW